MIVFISVVAAAFTIMSLVLWGVEGRPWWLRRSTQVDQMVFDAIKHRSFVWQYERRDCFTCHLPNDVWVTIGQDIPTLLDLIVVRHGRNEVYRATVAHRWTQKVAAQTLGDATALLKEATNAKSQN